MYTCICLIDTINNTLCAVLNTWLGFLVFSVSPKHLDTRLGVIVTLFLSLTALLFVISDYLPRSADIIPTQQMIIISYFFLGFIGVESILLYRLATYQKQREIKIKTQEARNSFQDNWKSFKSIHIRPGNRSGGALRRRTTTLRGNNNTAENNNTKDKGGTKPGRKRVLATNSSRIYVPGAFAGSVKSDGDDEGKAPAFNSDSDESVGREGDLEVGSSSRQILADGGGISSRTTGVDGIARKVTIVDRNGDIQQQKEETLLTIKERDSGNGETTIPLKSNYARLDTTTTVTTDMSSFGTESEGKKDKYYNRLQIFFEYFKKMKDEVEKNPNYALFLALQVDTWVFWICFLSYNIAIIVLLVVQSFNQPQLILF